ncbi:MAG: tRNA (adenosine(37)-N6)-dimethylallyltransferase MiaA, partial [Steroidobacteraceae bacterium]
AMRLIGYRQLWEHLVGVSTLQAARERAIVATRQLARRQLTWLRAEPDAEWFDPLDRETPERLAARIGAWLAKQ